MPKPKQKEMETKTGAAAEAMTETVRQIPLSDLHPFEGHPFKVLDDEFYGGNRGEYPASRGMEAKSSGRAGASASGAANGGKKTAEGTKSLVDKGIEFVKEHPKAILVIGVLGLMVMFIAGTFSSCTAMFAGSGNAVLETSYTAEDDDTLC